MRCLKTCWHIAKWARREFFGGRLKWVGGRVGWYVRVWVWVGGWGGATCSGGGRAPSRAAAAAAAAAIAAGARRDRGQPAIACAGSRPPPPPPPRCSYFRQSKATVMERMEEAVRGSDGELKRLAASREALQRTGEGLRSEMQELLASLRRR